MFNKRNNFGFCNYVNKHSGSIVQAYRISEQFVAAVKEDVTYADGEYSRILIRNESDYIVKLFKTAQEFIELAKIYCISAYNLINLPPYYIAQLFRTEEELTELAEVNKDLANCLLEIIKNKLQQTGSLSIDLLRKQGMG
jgi:hypothetical protein